MRCTRGGAFTSFNSPSTRTKDHGKRTELGNPTCTHTWCSTKSTTRQERQSRQQQRTLQKCRICALAFWAWREVEEGQRRSIWTHSNTKSRYKRRGLRWPSTLRKRQRRSKKQLQREQKKSLSRTQMQSLNCKIRMQNSLEPQKRLKICALRCNFAKA